MYKYTIIYSVVLLLSAWFPRLGHGQFNMTWLDIGEMHGWYSEAGAHPEGVTDNQGLEWPAILRGSSHYRSKAYWIGAKDWTDESGRYWDYRVARIGLRTDGYLTNPPSGSEIYTPVESKLIARFEDTEVVVDGRPSFDKIAIVNEVDPQLPADRVLYQRYRSLLGIETERWIYAYANEIHDDYHIIRRRMVNTGNTDADPDIELQDQLLNDVMFYNAYRWRGREQAAWHGGGAQVWGKFNMVDIVGDGNGAYPVDFTAVYLWYGFDWSVSFGEVDRMGSPLLRQLGREAPGDTTGRLAGMSMQGRVILHADESTTDRTYNPANQPTTLGWIDNDEPLNDHGQSEEAYYELGILTRENPAVLEGGSSRLFPHYADRIVPGGEFWERIGDAALGRAGGHSPTIAYGPYQMAFQDTINIVEAEGAAGLSYKAATDIGVAYKTSGFDNELRIPFDANGDGIITDVPWNYDAYKNGSEIQTKNQWVLTARDSMFQFMYRARDVWRASDGMTQYPIVEPPRPPRRFEVTSHPDNIELQWQSMPEEPDPVAWEVYRTSEYVDNLPYALVASLPGSARRYVDEEVFRGRDYYYFIQAVGTPNSEDELALNGTPGGLPLRSGRYFTQTYNPASLLRVPGNQVSDFRIVPNPINMASDESVRIIIDGDRTRGQVEFLDIPGQCTISIYTEIGELVKRIDHTTGSGNASWDLLTSSRQPVVSGIYLVHVADNESGQVNIKKLVVVR